MDLTLEEILADLHAMEQELQKLEARYGILSEDFYRLYMRGETEQNHDFHAWAGYYEIKLKREEMYRQRIADTKAAGIRLLDKCRELVAA
jgi:hypothetical protein